MQLHPLTAETLAEALAHRKAVEEEYYGLRYLRLRDTVHGAPRGTVVIDGRVIYGYPQIGRILQLGSGLKEQFQAPVWAEEKVDGYNVRIFRRGDELLGLSRGGFLCPFTSDRAAEFLPAALFDEQPDLVVCGEMAGPDNPYMEGCPPYIHEDIRLQVFDLARFDRVGFLDQRERLALSERHALPHAEIFGRFELDDTAPLKELLLAIEADGREGVVLKEESPRQKRAKVVTSNTSISDIRLTALNMLDLPPEYFTNRILRMVLFMDEAGIARDDELHRRLGAAFLDGLFEALEQYHREGRVFHTFRARFRKRENAERLLERITATAKRSHVGVSLRRLEREGE